MQPTSPISKTNAGFTLLELLVGITVSGIILTSAYGTFNTANRSARTMDAHAESLQSLRVLSRNLRLDLESIVPPGPGAKFTWAEAELKFPVQGGMKVSYNLEKDKVVRTTKGKSKEFRLLLATGVKSLKMEYYCEKTWNTSLRKKQWPRAVRCTLALKRQGDGLSQVVRIQVEPAGVIK